MVERLPEGDNRTALLSEFRTFLGVFHDPNSTTELLGYLRESRMTDQVFGQEDHAFSDSGMWENVAISYLQRRPIEPQLATMSWLLEQNWKKDGRILTIGCGPLLDLAFLKSKGVITGEISALDKSSEMTRIGKAIARMLKVSDGINIVQRDAFGIEDREHFDTVVFPDVLVWLGESWETVLKKGIGAAKEDGDILIISIVERVLGSVLITPLELNLALLEAGVRTVDIEEERGSVNRVRRVRVHSRKGGVNPQELQAARKASDFLLVSSVN